MVLLKYYEERDRERKGWEEGKEERGRGWGEGGGKERASEYKYIG